jgi:hypothetical protein
MVAERPRNGRPAQAPKTSRQGLQAILTALRSATFSLMLKSAVPLRTPGLPQPERDADHQSAAHAFSRVVSATPRSDRSGTQ